MSRHATLPVMRAVARYGWVPDLPDQRDLLLAPPPPAVPLPVRVDLEPSMPPVYDQGQLGSCTANAIAALLEREATVQGEPAATPSRLFIYYHERVIEGTVAVDAGAQIRDGMKVAAKLGAPPETDWPYDVSRFADAPTAAAELAARKHRAVEYRRVAHGSLMGCLAAGLPFAFGFTVYQSFETSEVAQSGVAHLPEAGDAVVGGHAVCAVGYEPRPEYAGAVGFKVRNSWGDAWGQAGYFWLPAAYLASRGLSSDFWTVARVA